MKTIKRDVIIIVATAAPGSTISRQAVEVRRYFDDRFILAILALVALVVYWYCFLFVPLGEGFNLLGEVSYDAVIQVQEITTKYLGSYPATITG